MYLHKSITDEEKDYDGKLPKLNKEVQKLLNMNTEKKENELWQIISGLISVITGISGLRNKKSDAHGKINTKYKPAKHHAILAANASKTIAIFYLDSYKYQKTNTPAIDITS